MTRSKESAQEAMLFFLVTAASEGGRPRLLGSILLSVVHLLFELLRLLLIHEAQAGDAFFQFEGVKKGAVMVVAPCVEDFLVPDDSTRRRLERENDQ